jgi:hypothetical protein
MVFTLTLAGPALAQDNPAENGYGGVLGEEVSNSDNGGGGGGGTNSDCCPPEETVAVSQGSNGGDSLPFTGFELGLVALAGFGLVTLGFVMRRSTRHSVS